VRRSTNGLRSPAIVAVLVAAAATAVRAQDPVVTPEATPQAPAAGQKSSLVTHGVDGAKRTQEVDDYYETHVQGGFRLTMAELGLTIRGEKLLILNDGEVMREALSGTRSSGLPTRGIQSPKPRRRLSPEAVRQRLQSALSAIGRTKPLPTNSLSDDAIRLFRYLYCEGGITVVQNGVEVMRCDRLWISPIDDRIVVENAELRYVTDSNTFVIRGPRLVKYGGRWVGHDLLLTTCTADKPHMALAVKEAEIIERPGEFEVVSRGQTLQIGGTSVLPLPNARFFTGSQSEFPIKRVSAGYSGRLGAQLGVTLGLPWNTTGGALHNWVTGRPANEFRGEWEFGVGWIEARGVPLDGSLTYSVPGLYEGRTDFFYLDDGGVNLREIRRNVDGSLLNAESRSVIRSVNRVHLAERDNNQGTHFDVVAFTATDASVYPEFFVGDYREQEVPETSAYLHHADGNHLLTVGTRFNLSDFSYRDDRYIGTRFIEELPVLTYQWLAQPIAETPWNTPIVLDTETQAGQRRSDFDDRTGLRVQDRSLRVDQHVEVSAPFHWGALNIRPFASGRGTFYDETVNGDSEERVALEGGFQIASRLSRTWRWIDENGERDAMRHVIAPRLTYRNRYHVDDAPSTLLQYDEFPFRAETPLRQSRLGYDPIDRLSERELVRFEVRNLFQKMDKRGASDNADDPGQPRDFVFFDLAQDFLPNSTRDNRGEVLGLFYYDLLLRPDVQWLPFDDFAFAVYGDIDWARGMQTFDTELQFGKVLGIDWTVEYREDRTVDGAVALAGRTQIYDRWSVFASAQRDIDRGEWLSYVGGLRRDDHDWSIALTAIYNPFINETTFRLEFTPRFGGMKTRRNDRFDGRVQDNRYSFDY